MKGKLAFVLLIVVLVTVAMKKNLAPAFAAPQPAPVDEATRQQILRATVQIAMYEADAGTGVEAGDRGLGTLVRHDGQTLIVTHDHWRHFGPNLTEVEFRDAQGRLLLGLPKDAFQELIRHRDGGTMVLAAPQAVAAAFVPTSPAGAEGLAGGSRLWTVRRAGAGGAAVEVVGVALEAVQREAAPARLRLRGAGGVQVAPGDSGGGVWHNGQLVGNLWSGGVMVQQSLWQRLLGAQTETATSLIVAALQPLGQATGVPQAGPDSQGLPLKLGD